MTKFDVVFPLNESQKIIIISPITFNELHCCDKTTTIFLQGSSYCILSTDSFRCDLERLILLLTKAIQNELQINKKITADLGYLICQNKQYEASSYISEIYDYFLWSPLEHPNPRMASWIYNNPDGSIIFEITPRYPWEYEGSELEQEFIFYEEWIKSYKPYLITTIPHYVAKRWLEQATKLLEIIEQNVKKEFNIAD